MINTLEGLLGQKTYVQRCKISKAGYQVYLLFGSISMLLCPDPDQGQENKCGSMWIQIQIHSTGYRGSFSYDFDIF
jgi:hypothetical protein